MSKESVVVSCIRRSREYGEGIVLADQCISSIKDVVKNNVYTIVGMGQAGQRDRREMISVLGLNPEQAQFVHFLDVGQGIVRLAGRYPLPVLLKFPYVKISNISDQELDKLNNKDLRVRLLLSHIKYVQEEPQEFSGSNGGPDKTLIPEQAKDLLNDIYYRFDMPSSKRTKDLGLSASAADKLFKLIEREQLGEPFLLNLEGGRGKTSKFYELTSKGHEVVSKKPPKRSGGTGPVHFFLERYLKKHLPRVGFSDVEIEKNFSGKRIDVFGIYASLRVGIEICCSTMRTEHLNFFKDIPYCDLVVVVTPDKKTKANLDKELSKTIKTEKTLKTCVVSRLLNHPDQIIAKT